MQRQAIVKATGENDNTRIYEIELTNRSIAAILPLKEYQKLRYLNLSYNLIERIENLQGITDLRELHLENNNLTRIAGLEANKNLQVLNLANNKIEKIENIAHLIKLQTLILDSNCLSKLTGLEYLKDLKTLSVCSNSLGSIEILPTFSKLSNLLLSHNKITKISSNLFMSSKALQILDLSHNMLEITTFLQHLSSLMILNLSNNNIRNLEVPPMLNLQSLNLSFNQIQKLPSIAICFPELICLDLSHNLLCSEIELLSALSEVTYLTELDFLENPMYNETFSSVLQKIHSFDYLNNKPMSKAGAKYYQQVAEIQADLQKNRQFYGVDDQKDRQIKMSGFYDEELEFQMSGLRSNRPSSPKKKRNLEAPTFYDDLDRSYHQFVANDKRIKMIREHYLNICGQYNLAGSERIITQPPESQRLQPRSSLELGAEEKKSDERKYSASQQLQVSEAEIHRENERNLSKWKELKNREKNFNIHKVMKSRGRDNSVNRAQGSSTNTNWTTNTGIAFKPERERSQLFKTQNLPRRVDDQVFKGGARPSSMRKKE